MKRDFAKHSIHYYSFFLGDDQETGTGEFLQYRSSPVLIACWLRDRHFPLDNGVTTRTFVKRSIKTHFGMLNDGAVHA